MSKVTFLIFGFFLLINIVSTGGHLDTWDGVEAFLVTESMIIKHSAKLHPDVPSIKELNFPIQDSVDANRYLQGKKDVYISPLKSEGISTLKGSVTLLSNVTEKGVNSIEGRLRVVAENKTDNHAGLVWNDGNREYYALLRHDALSLYGTDGLSITSAPAIRDVGKWYGLKVIYLNNTINILLDNISKIQSPAVNNSQTISKVGIRSYNSVTDFDKISISPVSPLNSEKVVHFSKLAESVPPVEPMYTSRSLLVSAMAVPFYYLATLFEVSPIPIVSIFVNSSVISLIGVVIFCFSFEIYGSKRIAFILSLIFTVCSFIWPYNTTLLPQPLSALCLIASAFFIYKSAKVSGSKKKVRFSTLGGLLLGLSIFAHPTSAIFVPAFLVFSIAFLRHNKKSLGSFIITLGILLCAAGLVNYLRFGSFNEFGYGSFQSLSNHVGWKGLLGLLISPGAGIVFFFPIAILVPISSYFLYKSHRGLLFLSIYIVIVSWLYFGTASYPVQSFIVEPSVWTGLGWGPRYLIPTLPFIMIILGAVLTNLKGNPYLKVSIIVLSIAGFVINLMGTLIWYQYGYFYGRASENLQFYDNNYNQTKVGTLGAMTWIPDFSPIFLHSKMLVSGYFSEISSNELQVIQNSWPHALAPCSYDIFLYCKFGILSIIVSSAVIVVVAIILIAEIINIKHRLVGRHFLSYR